MLGPLAAYRPFGWDEVVGLAATGFLFGLATNLRGPLGIAVGSNTIDAARCPAAFRQARLPLLPRCVFGALVLPALAVLYHWNSPFLSEHALYLVCLAGFSLSSGAWLLRASGFIAAASRRKEEDIREFLSDPQVSAPRGEANLPPPPPSFRLWNALNFTAFLILILIALREFLRESPHR